MDIKNYSGSLSGRGRHKSIEEEHHAGFKARTGYGPVTGHRLGPLTAGAVFDHYDSYGPFLLATIILMGLSAMALFSLDSTPTAEQITARSKDTLAS